MPIVQTRGEEWTQPFPYKAKASYTLCQGLTCPSALPLGSRSFVRHHPNRYCEKVLLTRTLKEEIPWPPFGSDIVNPGLKYTNKRCCTHGCVRFLGQSQGLEISIISYSVQISQMVQDADAFWKPFLPQSTHSHRTTVSSQQYIFISHIFSCETKKGKQDSWVHSPFCLWK